MLVCVTCSTVTQDANPIVISINNKIFLISFVLKGNGYKDREKSPPWLKERGNSQYPIKKMGPIPLFSLVKTAEWATLSPTPLQTSFIGITIEIVIRKNQMVNQTDIHKIRCGIHLFSQ